MVYRKFTDEELGLIKEKLDEGMVIRDIHKQFFSYRSLAGIKAKIKRDGLKVATPVNESGLIHKPDRLDNLLVKHDLSEDELMKVLKTKEYIKPTNKIADIDYGSGHVKFAVISDTHIGSIYFHEKDLLQTFKKIEKEKVDFIIHPGDHVDGFYAPHRMQQLWELEDLGYTQQMKHVLKLYKEAPNKIFGIDGNHDDTYVRLVGAIIGEELEDKLGKDNFEHLGKGEGHIKLGDMIIQIRHPGTGSAYALSYRSQKYADSITGGTKPNMSITGHHHKFFYMMYRNILMLEAGTLCSQTRFQRDKELANHKGFSFVELKYNKKGITRAKIDWIPMYE